MTVRWDSLANLAWTQLWQVTVIAVIITILARVVSRSRPHLAYVLWLLLVVKCLTPPVWYSPAGVFGWLGSTEVLPSPSPTAEPNTGEPLAPAAGPVRMSKAALPGGSSPVLRPAADAAPAKQQRQPLPNDAPAAAPRHGSATIAGWLLAVWLSGMIAYGTMVLGKRWSWQKVLRRAKQPEDTRLVTLIAELSSRFRLRQRVRLLATSQPLGPAVVGVVRPALLLPDVLLQRRSPKEIEPIIAHELIHVRRGDAAVGLLQMLAQRDGQKPLEFPQQQVFPRRAGLLRRRL
jgi:beta-lactamase regulating signal transducer with metallopeptidase domain